MVLDFQSSRDVMVTFRFPSGGSQALTTWAKKAELQSVKARVVETKQKLFGSLERLFLFYLHLFYSTSIYFVFLSISFFLVVFVLIFIRTYSLMKFGFFWPEGVRVNTGGLMTHPLTLRIILARKFPQASTGKSLLFAPGPPPHSQLDLQRNSRRNIGMGQIPS